METFLFFTVFDMICPGIDPTTTVSGQTLYHETTELIYIENTDHMETTP